MATVIDKIYIIYIIYNIIYSVLEIFFVFLIMELFINNVMYYLYENGHNSLIFAAMKLKFCIEVDNSVREGAKTQ